MGFSQYARLDPRYYHLRAQCAPLHEALIEPVSFGSFAKFANGVNLPRRAYATTEAAGSALYASVAAFPVYVLRREGCVPLLEEEGRIVGTKARIADVAATHNEVLITRSRASAPGVAWPADLAPADMPLVPAGFLIRAELPGTVEPSFIAAVLNHPAWRILTAALAAGKSQDNLSQALLARVPVPAVSQEAQVEIARQYRSTLDKISQVFEDESDFAAVCDRVLAEDIPLVAPTLPDQPVRARRVALRDVATTRSLRLDNRWHGPDNAAIRRTLGAHKLVRFRSLLIATPTKGRQPALLRDDEVLIDSPGAIATVTIQSGTIANSQTKPTTPESVERFPVRAGDLLIAMDGDGSLGKAAVYDGPADATVDSHVACCRVDGGGALADALSCWLNSTWGRVQTAGLMTGATGQTQLNTADLCDVIVPVELVAKAESLSARYRDALGLYEPLTRRVRRILCAASADLTNALISDGALAETEEAQPFRDEERLLVLLEQLHPSVRSAPRPPPGEESAPATAPIVRSG